MFILGYLIGQLATGLLFIKIYGWSNVGRELEKLFDISLDID